MKRAVFLLFFCLMSRYSDGAITQAQIVQVSTTTAAIQNTVNNFAVLVSIVQPLITASNTYSLYFSTNTVSLTAQQQQDIVSYYQSLKTTLQSQANSLP